MTTRATRDKWIKACDATVAREKERLAKAAALAQQCRDRIKAAEQRKEWLTAMPVEDPEDPAEEPTATDVGEPDVDEIRLAKIVDVRAVAEAMGDEPDDFAYPQGEGEVPVRKGIRARPVVPVTDDASGEPSDWAQDA